MEILLADGFTRQGYYSIRFDGNDLSNGIYFYQCLKYISIPYRNIFN